MSRYCLHIILAKCGKRMKKKKKKNDKSRKKRPSSNNSSCSSSSSSSSLTERKGREGDTTTGLHGCARRPPAALEPTAAICGIGQGWHAYPRAMGSITREAAKNVTHFPLSLMSRGGAGEDDTALARKAGALLRGTIANRTKHR